MSGYHSERKGFGARADTAGSHVTRKSDAFAIAMPEVSNDAVVTPSAQKDGIRIPGEAEPEDRLLASADDDLTPSILREYNYSFLRIWGYSIIWTMALIACF